MKRIPSMDSLHASRAWSGVPAGFVATAKTVSHRGRRILSRAANLRELSQYRDKTVLLGRRVARMTRQLSTKSLQAFSSSSSGATSAAAVLGRSDSSDDSLTFDLDWRPNLSLTQEVICWSVAAALTCLVYTLTAPPSLSIPYGTCMGLLFGLSLYLLRGTLLEELYKARERIEKDLGDADSRFRDLGNLLVHVKVKSAKTLPPPVAQNPAAARYAPPPASNSNSGQQPAAAVHCYHGFGSNTWSWTLVQQQIAEKLGALVTAHDMPGFGLTQRPTDLSSYYLAFNGRLGRLAMDYELAIRGLLSMRDALKSGESGYPHTTGVHEASSGAAGAGASEEVAAVGAGSEQQLVMGLEAAAGGSPAAAAGGAVETGLESPMQAAGAQAAKGNIGGAVAAAAGAAAATSSSGRKASAAAAAPAAAAAGTGGSTTSTTSSSSKVKRVLMGHSLGGACAALEYIANPSDYSAIVLVDPAIIAGLGGAAEKDAPNSPVKLEKLQDGTAFTRSLASGDAAAGAAGAAQPAGGTSASGLSSSSSSMTAELDELAAAQGNLSRSSSTSGGGGGASGSGSESDNSATGAGGGGSGALGAAIAAGDVVLYATRGDEATFAKLIKEQQEAGQANAAVKLLTNSIGLIRSFVMFTTVLALSVLRPVIVVLLRVAVRSRKFWANTLEQAYYDKSKVTPEAVDAYRLPQLVRGWESGMVQFLMARLGGGGSRGATTAASAVGAAPPGGLEDANLAVRFAAAVAAHGTPVLIVHGAGDKLIPPSNSFKLARLIKGCRLAVVKKAGHCPQEEEPEVFEGVVSSFLGKRLGLQG